LQNKSLNKRLAPTIISKKLSANFLIRSFRKSKTTPQVRKQRNARLLTAKRRTKIAVANAVVQNF